MGVLWYDVYIAPTMSYEAMKKVRRERTRAEVERRLPNWDATDCAFATVEDDVCRQHYSGRTGSESQVYKYTKGGGYITVFYDSEGGNLGANAMD